MIEGLGPYPKMKDSGVAWLGEVPEHWAVRRGKTLFTCVDVRSEAGDEELLTVSSDRGVVPRSSTSVTMFKAESYVGYKLCWPGDLVINSLWAWARGLGVSRHHGIVSSAYGVYRMRPGFTGYSGYVHELVRSVPFQWELQVRSKGIWISRLQLTDEAFLEAPVPLPPPAEQAAIVRFLDHADRQIRRYVRAKQQLIKLLEEEEKAIVHRAVTRGLQPNVRVRPSGVELLHEIPEHWEVVTLRRVISRAVDGPHHSPRYLDDGIPFLSARNIKADRWSLGNVKYISEEDFQEFSKRVVPEVGDVLYTKGGTTGIARAVDLPFRFQVWVHVAVLKVRRDKILPAYLAVVLNSHRSYEQAQLLTKGATNQDLGLGRMKAIAFALPPIDEQRTILEALEHGTRRIRAALVRGQRGIDVAREYRTRLIADVVTGKLDIRAAAERLLSKGDEPELLEEADEGFDVQAMADDSDREAEPVET